MSLNDGDDKTVDYRKRCIIPGESHDVIIYGMTAREAPRSNAIDLRDTFNHSGSAGRTTGRCGITERTPCFFTPRLEGTPLGEFVRKHTTE